VRLVLELGLAAASCRSVGFDKTTDPSSLPDVDIYAEKGSGIPTIVGARLDNLTSGQVVTPATTLLTRDGDGNQEYITNNAVLAWRTIAIPTSASPTTPASTTSPCPGAQ
jgi:lecithin-cholesterol acyltransferase